MKIDKLTLKNFKFFYGEKTLDFESKNGSGKMHFEEGELPRDSVVVKYATTAADNKTYQVEHYNLDLVRVK